MRLLYTSHTASVRSPQDIFNDDFPIPLKERKKKISREEIFFPGNVFWWSPHSCRKPFFCEKRERDWFETRWINDSVRLHLGLQRPTSSESGQPVEEKKKEVKLLCQQRFVPANELSVDKTCVKFVFPSSIFKCSCGYYSVLDCFTLLMSFLTALPGSFLYQLSLIAFFNSFL